MPTISIFLYFAYSCVALFAFFYNVGHVGCTRESFPPRQSTAFKCKVSEVYQEWILLPTKLTWQGSIIRKDFKKVERPKGV